MKDRLTAIITTKNNAVTIRACIKRVLEAPPDDKEVIVVYGRSNDGTEEIVKQFGDKVKILCDNVGTGSAINTGVLDSRGNVIFYVEGHSFVAKDAFVSVLKEFEANPDVGYIVFYRYVPPNFEGTAAQKVMNFLRMEMKNSTMGQFRAFRRRTFFDVGGFWVFPKGADDFEFATRMYDTKWKMKVIHSKSWDYPRRDILSNLKHAGLFTGACESCWYHIYNSHPYASKEYKISRSDPMSVLYKMIIRKLIFAPVYALKVAITKKYLSFFPVCTLIRWTYIIGFFIGKVNWWGKERLDGRVSTLSTGSPR